jgi:DnaD/phage-associated family protein
MPDERTPFRGFGPGKFDTLLLPPGFLSDLLPRLIDPGEIKVLLFCFWALPQKEGRYRYLRRRDFAGNAALMDGLRALISHVNPDSALDDALARSVADGALLCVQADGEALYFANTEAGRAAAESIAGGHYAVGDADNPVEILPERPNIYRLYEENIGPLTPKIADELKDAEREYPAAWIDEAVREAVIANKRSWRYIRAILKRWRAEGRDDGERSEKDGRRYVTGKYAEYIEH